MIHRVSIGTMDWEFMFRDRQEIVRQMANEPNNPGHVRLNGDISALLDIGRARVAVIGTRDADPSAREYTRRIIENLSRREEGQRPVIVSGLAMGVDTEAHQQALDCRLPTIAVMATGLDTVYPYKNRALAEAISMTSGSGLLTSFPDNTAPTAFNFLYRNRIIALLSDAVIVVASKSKGGAIVTAKLAHEWGIPVYAVPGRPEDVRFRGCNELIAKHIAEPLFDFDALQDMSL